MAELRRRDDIALAEGLTMKVLPVDGHPLIVAALRAVIQGMGDDVTVVGAASACGARGGQQL